MSCMMNLQMHQMYKIPGEHKASSKQKQNNTVQYFEW